MSCPICKKPGAASYRPFCSKRCADVDLGRWLTGGYALEAQEDPEESTVQSPDISSDYGSDNLH